MKCSKCNGTKFSINDYGECSVCEVKRVNKEVHTIESKRMSNEELLHNIKQLITTIYANTKNIYSVDYRMMLDIEIEIDERHKEENLIDQIILKTCSKCNHQPCLIYGIDNKWYVECYNCQESTDLHANKRAAVIAWYNKNKQKINKNNCLL